jgi:hypothetical protein
MSLMARRSALSRPHPQYMEIVHGPFATTRTVITPLFRRRLVEWMLAVRDAPFKRACACCSPPPVPVNCG